MGLSIWEKKICSYTPELYFFFEFGVSKFLTVAFDILFTNIILFFLSVLFDLS